MRRPLLSIARDGVCDTPVSQTLAPEAEPSAVVGHQIPNRSDQFAQDAVDQVNLCLLFL